MCATVSVRRWVSNGSPGFLHCFPHISQIHPVLIFFSSAIRFQSCGYRLRSIGIESVGLLDQVLDHAVEGTRKLVHSVDTRVWNFTCFNFADHRLCNSAPFTQFMLVPSALFSPLLQCYFHQHPPWVYIRVSIYSIFAFRYVVNSYFDIFLI